MFNLMFGVTQMPSKYPRPQPTATSYYSGKSGIVRLPARRRAHEAGSRHPNVWKARIG